MWKKSLALVSIASLVASFLPSFAIGQSVLPATIIAVPSIIQKGETTAINWDAPEAEYCTASGGWSGQKGSSGFESVKPKKGVVSYSLQCFDDEGRATKKLSVSVKVQSKKIKRNAPLPVVTFKSTATGLGNGEVATLSWKAKNAIFCRGGGDDVDWNGMKKPSGKEEILIDRDTEYALSCLNKDGKVTTASSLKIAYKELETSDTAQTPQEVTIVPGEQLERPLITMTAGPSIVSNGESVSIGWSARNATSCKFLSPVSSELLNVSQTSGAVTVYPTQTTDYKIQCVNSRGNTSVYETSSITVTVGATKKQEQKQAIGIAPTVTFTSSTSAPIKKGQMVRLEWSSQNATRCAMTGQNISNSDNVGTSGFLQIFPGQTEQFSIQCFSASGMKSDSHTIVVQVDASSARPEIMKLNVNPFGYAGMIKPGTAVAVIWESKNADYCTAAGDWSGKKAARGDEIVIAPSKSGYASYGLTCFTNDGASSIMTAVTPEVGYPKMSKTNAELEKAFLFVAKTALSSYPDTVVDGIAGGTITLQWDVPDASTCEYLGTDPRSTGTFVSLKSDKSVTIGSKSQNYFMRCNYANNLSLIKEVMVKVKKDANQMSFGWVNNGTSNTSNQYIQRSKVNANNPPYLFATVEKRLEGTSCSIEDLADGTRPDFTVDSRDALWQIVPKINLSSSRGYTFECIDGNGDIINTLYTHVNIGD